MLRLLSLSLYFLWLLVAPSLAVAFILGPLHRHRHHHCSSNQLSLFLLTQSQHQHTPSSPVPSRLRTTTNDDDDDDGAGDDLPLTTPTALVTARLPTSVDDQIRQCVQSIQLATTSSNDNENNNSNNNNNQMSRRRRHTIRLLLPLIGASDLDDWPGGARQMMQAAAPLVEGILQGLGILDTDNNNNKNNKETNSIQKVCLDRSDGVYAWLAQAERAKNDCVFVLLPTAESVVAIQDTLEQQVGPHRNIFWINPQWRRRADFGGFIFGRVDETIVSYVEGYPPTYSLTNLICEGESIRVLHTHGSGWRVFVQNNNNNNNNDIIDDWVLVGEKPFVVNKPANWEQLPANKKDGGRLFDYGMPSYQEIYDMLLNSPNYTPKSPAERAATAFNFVKDTL